MPNDPVGIPRTFSFGRGGQIANNSLLAGDIVLTGFPPNPFDLSDFPGSNAGIRDYCSCDPLTTDYSPLDVAPHPYHNLSFLFRRKAVEQLMPQKISSPGSCQRLPSDGLKNQLMFHVFQDGVLNFHLQGSSDNPSGDNTRVDLRNITQDILDNDIYLRGYEGMYGDQPGYKSGRTVSFELAKIKMGLIPASTIKKKTLTVTKDGDFTKIEGCSGLYMRELYFYFSSMPDDPDRRFHLIFKYNVDLPETCGAEAYRARQTIKNERIIDNIGITPTRLKTNPSPQSGTGSPADVLNAANPKKTEYVAVDCRFTTADYIEMWGFQPDLDRVEVHYLEPRDYFENVCLADSFCSTFDAQGRLFVFYQDDINYTELPYAKFDCVEPSSSTATSSTTSVSSTTSGGGPGGIVGGGAGGGGGGGAGGGGGGIPGDPAQNINYKVSSSTTGISSSTSTSVSSSSSGGITNPPPAPRNGIITAGSNAQADKAVVDLTWFDGFTLPGAADALGPPDTIPTNSPTVSYNIYRSTQIDGPYTLIGSTTSLHFTDSDPVVNSYNYYRITAVNAQGQESGYLLLSVFVPAPKPCVGRDCAGCASQNYKSRDSFTVWFSDFDPHVLNFECNSCDENDGFIRILREAFFNKNRSNFVIGGQTQTFVPTSVDEEVPVFFCLLPDCQDGQKNQDGTTSYPTCRWTNTFYIPALQFNCAGFGCRGEYEKVLIPFTITVTQDKDNGWSMEAYAISPDCKRMDLFRASNILTACQQPVRFINEIKVTSDSYVSTETTAALSNNACGIFPPQDYLRNTGTISCAMSPDLGNTWYNFRGIINISQNKKAVQPFVTLDPRKNIIHLFYVERDYTDDNASDLTQFPTGKGGYQADLKHVRIDPFDMLENDAFKTYWPTPTINPDIPATKTASDNFRTSQLQQFSLKGQQVRKYEAQTVEHADYNPKTDDIQLSREFDSAYVDSKGRLCVARFLESGTLVDPPSRLTRRRRRQTVCGSFTWTVSGISDSDCACQALNGSFELILDSRTQAYVHDKWTLQVSADFNYWEMTAANGMLIFRHKRDITLCPPTGIYEITCDRCQGGIVGTLDVQQLAVLGNGVFINSGDFNPAQNNGTDFGQVPNGFFKNQDFVIRNTTNDVINFTGNPHVDIEGANASEFTVLTGIPDSLQPGDQATFTVQFKPNGTNCIDPTQDKKGIGIHTAQVRIVSDDKLQNPYFFNIEGRCVPPDNAPSTNDKQIQSNFTPGAVASADAIGKIYTSLDEGVTWGQFDEIKTGSRGSAIYDQIQGVLWNVYVTNDMLFTRRYPAILYSAQTDQASQLEPAFDGINIVDPPQVLIPSPDIFSTGIPTSALGFIGMPTFFDLPIINVPGTVYDTTEADLRSIKTKLINEKDPGGLPVFVAGNRSAAIENAYFPYQNSYTFDQTNAVASSKPAAYVTKDGKLRFFYVDTYGNVNAGTISGTYAALDTKLKGIKNV